MDAMVLTGEAVHRDGVIQLTFPVELPDNTPLRVVLFPESPAGAANVAGLATAMAKIRAMRGKYAIREQTDEPSLVDALLADRAADRAREANRSQRWATSDTNARADDSTTDTAETNQ